MEKLNRKLSKLDVLQKQYDNPIEHFINLAKQKNIDTKTIPDNSHQKNLGYVILKKVYNELDISSVLNKKQISLNIKYSLDEIMKLLVFSRILYPASKNETFNNKDIFFDKFNFFLKDMYRSLDYFEILKNEIIKSIWYNTKDSYKRDTSITYYDTTNYYFEISYNDEDLIDENGKVLGKR